MSDDIAIRVDGLGKRYRIAHETAPYKTLGETISRTIRAPYRHFAGEDPSRSTEEFWALRDVSFEVKRGEVIGIIGRNGAGKSTLLKILSRITIPTEGTVEAHGRIGSLLEVGTGFHPELTGRENVFLSGSIMGMKKAEIEEKFDQIVKFAEIEQFLDTPVKRYSSGMYVRLAFAVAAHLEPEILIVDEVLAVGDAAFQKKCLGKMGDVAKEGRTVLFVSHNMAAVENLCNCAILLENGKLISKSDVNSIVNSYLSGNNKQQAQIKSSDGINLEVSIRSQEAKNIIRIGDTIQFTVILTSEKEIPDAGFGIGITNSLGNRIITFHTHFQYHKKWGIKKRCKMIIEWPNNFLCPGDYTLIAALYDVRQLIKSWDNLGTLSITSMDYFGTGKLPDPSHQGCVLANSKWNIETDL